MLFKLLIRNLETTLVNILIKLKPSRPVEISSNIGSTSCPKSPRVWGDFGQRVRGSISFFYTSNLSEILHSAPCYQSREIPEKTKVIGQRAEKILNKNLQNRPKSPRLTVFVVVCCTSLWRGKTNSTF